MRQYHASGGFVTHCLRHGFFSRFVTIRLSILALTMLSLSTVSPAFAQYVATQKLIHEGGPAGGNFGQTVATDECRLIVGAGFDNGSSNAGFGSAYIYHREDANWALEAILVASDGQVFDQFGTDVSISGNVAVVGASGAGNESQPRKGAAYVFERTGNIWNQVAKLAASDGTGGDYLGNSVCVSGDSIIVGAFQKAHNGHSWSGAAYIFVRSGENWVQQAKLIASDEAGGDYFGISVSLSGETAVVGAHRDNVGLTENQGSAYVFSRTNTTWTQTAHLTATNGGPQQYLGVSVEVAGNVIVAGSIYGGGNSRGSAHIFVREGETWTEQMPLSAPDGVPNDGFGSSLALTNDWLLVGAPRADVNPGAREGAAYLYHASNGTWIQAAKLIAPDGAHSDGLGAVALCGRTAVVGSCFDDIETHQDQGSAWSFTINTFCDSIDFNNDTSFYDPIDIDAFLSVYAEGGCIPPTATCNDIDFNNDTSLFDPCDIDSFLTVYSEGPCTACGE